MFCSFLNMLIKVLKINDWAVIFITISATIFIFFNWRYQYWKKRNLQYLKPLIPFGSPSITCDRTHHFGIRLKQIYDIMREKGWKHGGVYLWHLPVYIVTDLEYLKNIMSKDFHYFDNRGLYYNEKADPLSTNLFNINGPKWRNLRSKITSSFTSSKMKMMFQTMLNCEVNLRKQIKLYCEKEDSIDIKEVLERFTTDIIGSCAFGLECNTFKEQNSPFRFHGQKVFERNLLTVIKRQFANNFSNLAQMLNVAIFSKDTSDFFINLVKNTVCHREKNKIVRNDFLQTLIDMKIEDSKQNNTCLTIEEIAAQCFVLFLGGYETSSTVMTFVLYELARNQHIQDKVRKEIHSVLENYEGQITYEAIQKMKYLGQVIDETLRMYSPASFLPRKCVKDYKISDCDVTIEKGTLVLIPTLGIHYDKEYYPDPETFDPDRFSEQNKSLRHSYAHLPFGEGPRICIGIRFGIMQTKLGLVSLLKNFKFTIDEKTQEPLQMKVSSLVLAAKGGIWLNAHEI